MVLIGHMMQSKPSTKYIRPFILETDASSHDLKGVLIQHYCPIAFINHVLLPRGCQKSVYGKELMAIVFAVQKWCHYLLGTTFIFSMN